MKNVMSVIIATMVAFVCVQANADYTIPRYYPKVQVPTISPEHPDYVIPDGSDHELLPPILPCVSSNYGIRCNYLMYPSRVTLPSTSPGEYVSVFLETKYICRLGRCKSEYGESGSFPENVNAKVNIWYRLEASKEGDLIAVRRDLDFGRPSRNAEAGASLYIFYLESGVDEKTAQDAMEFMYIGGWNKYVKDHEEMCLDPTHDFSYCGD